jgi:hypothetical protein
MKTTRPKRIWIVAILLAALAVGLLIATAIRALNSWPTVAEYPWRLIAWPLMNATICGTLGAGLFLRWRWSRWGAVALLLAFAVSMGWDTVSDVAGNKIEPVFPVDTDSPSYKIGEVLGTVLVLVLFVSAPASFIWSKRVRAYFEEQKKPNQSALPTPV